MGKESSKEKINESVSNFSRNIFSELDEVYEKTGIKSDIQIKESDIASFTDIKTEDDLKSKFENIREKLEKIIARISEFRTWIINKYRTEINNVLSLKSEQKEKEFEVLNFMRSSGFELIPKEISDKVIREVQGGTLKIP